VAFEAFRAQSEAPARAGRKRLWYALSIGFHGALIVAGIAYSFWHIEELSPPLLKVTFLSAAPPPPPAPPPPAGGGATAKKKVTPKPKVIVPKTELVQPKEIPKKDEPKEEPKAEDHGEKDGVKDGTIGGTPGGSIGGVKGGTVGGTPGGVIGAPPAAPKFLPPNMAKQQLLDGPEPELPSALNRGDYLYRVLVKICVSTAGTVDKVTLMKGADSLLDAAVLSKVKTWKFRALLANNVPVPFCYPATFEFKRQ